MRCDRIEKLEKALAEAKTALAACEKPSKRLAGRAPAARCTTAVVTAATARGRAAG